MPTDKIQLFEDQTIRTACNEDTEEWYFSIVDVVRVLTESKDPTAYWRKIKQRLKPEGNESPRRYWSDLKRKLKNKGEIQLYENIV